jgi:lipoprotein signal peptidase
MLYPDENGASAPGVETEVRQNSFLSVEFKMAALLDRYYAITLVSTLLAPLWFAAFASPVAQRLSGLHDALIWTAILLTGLLAVRLLPRYGVRGEWRKPTRQESNFYLRLFLAVMIIDYGSKVLFFRWNRPGQIEIFKNFGLHSVFHATGFETFHVFLLLYFGFLFWLGPWYFRFSNRHLDRIWMAASTFALGGAVALTTEKFISGGVRDSFYFAGPLMWICPPCASPRFSSYAWTPADLFVHAAIVPFFVLLASYLVTGRRSEAPS